MNKRIAVKILQRGNVVIKSARKASRTGEQLSHCDWIRAWYYLKPGFLDQLTSRNIRTGR